MENCYVEDDFLVCFCGKCKPEDYELPSDFIKLSKHIETNDRGMKSPIKWKIYWWATSIRDYGWPIVTPLADFIRDKTWVYEDHKD